MFGCGESLLSNTAESHHRVRKVIERNVRSGSLTETVRDGDYSDYPAQPLNTTLGTVQRLLGTHGEGDEANSWKTGQKDKTDAGTDAAWEPDKLRHALLEWPGGAGSGRRRALVLHHACSNSSCLA